MQKFYISDYKTMIPLYARLDSLCLVYNIYVEKMFLLIPLNKKNQNVNILPC